MCVNGSSRFAVVYERGLAVSIYPKPNIDGYDIRDYAYRATLLFVDGTPVNLLKSTDIHKIDANLKIETTPSSVGRIENDLRFQAQNIRNAGYHEQSVLILQKAHSIMKNYPAWWKPDAFFTLPEWLYEDGRDEEAEVECKRIRAMIDDIHKKTNNILDSSHNDLIKRCAACGTDLVVIDYQHTCCSECAKHRSRIYSLTGDDKRFPPLPDKIKNSGSVHEGCTCIISPTLMVSVMVGVKNNKTVYLYGEDAIRYSNRPFEDDRTEEDRTRYLNWKARRDKKAQDQQYIGFEDRVRVSGRNRRMYNFVCENLPQISPKSCNAYMRMKKQRTEKYLRITQLMAEKGINIEVY